MIAQPKAYFEAGWQWKWEILMSEGGVGESVKSVKMLLQKPIVVEF